MKKIDNIHEIRSVIHDAKRSGKVIGVVPTMGALHDGHLSLVDAARKKCDFVVTTIFVNPTQFAEGEDLSKYPRPIESDLEKLKSRTVDIAFCPTMDQMYPAGFSTFVAPPAVAELLEGKKRPTHFRGVTTIVLKLFQLVPGDYAFFGQKDYQQSLVIKTMVKDLNLPIQIDVCPIIREKDGLAMSSRNVYLSPDERKRALALNGSLREIESAFDGFVENCKAKKRPNTSINTASSPQGLEQFLKHTLTKTLDSAEIKLKETVDALEYLVVRDAQSLQELSDGSEKAVALVAARVGNTRLIDNCLINLT